MNEAVQIVKLKFRPFKIEVNYIYFSLFQDLGFRISLDFLEYFSGYNYFQ